MGDRPNLRFGIVAPDGTEVMPKRQWLWSKDRVQEASQKGELAFLKDKDGNWSVHTKQYLRDEEGNQRQAKAFSIIDDIFTQHGTNEIIDLFGDAHAFSSPKPSTLISRLLQLGASEPDSIILDFFAGSGTTGQAVLDYNNSDGGGRRFILVQLPEPIEKGEFRTIADITKERLRRVVSRIRKNSEASLQPLFANSTPKMDLGFRVFRLDSSNFQLWDPNSTPQSVELIKQVEIFVDHIKPDRSQEDILHEILLKSGFELSVKIVSIDLAGLKVFDVQDRSLAICLEKKLTKECILEIAKLNPIRVVCLDAGFAGNDQLKVNAVETFKAKGITFKTV
jgi:adenine-specific DNA-methyltransferase